MTDISIPRPLSPSHPSPDASAIRRRKSATRKEETVDTKQNDRPVSFFFLQSGSFRLPLNANVRIQVLADALHSDVLETIATQIIIKHKQVTKSLHEIGKMEKKRCKDAEKAAAQAAAAAAAAASAASPQSVVPSVTMPNLPASVTASPASTTLPTVSAPKSPPKDGITPRPPKSTPPASRPSSSHERPLSASSRLSTARKTTKKEKDGSRPGSPSVNAAATTTAAAAATTTTTTTTTTTAAPAAANAGTPTAASATAAPAATGTSTSGATTPASSTTTTTTTTHQRRTSNIEEKKKRTGTGAGTGTGTTPRTEKGNGSKKGKKKGVEDEEERRAREREEREAAEAAHKQSLITLESTLLQQLGMIRDLQHAAQERHDAMIDLVDMDGNPIALHIHPDVLTNTLVRAAHTYQLATIVPGTNNVVPIQCAI